jgi:hypothetical protein
MNNVIVPAHPGFNLLELCVTGAGEPMECIKHPVIAWSIEREEPVRGSVEPRHISWPITATDCPRYQAMLLPGGAVEGPDGSRFDDVSQWLQSMSESVAEKV